MHRNNKSLFSSNSLHSNDRKYTSYVATNSNSGDTNTTGYMYIQVSKKFIGHICCVLEGINNYVNC